MRRGHAEHSVGRDLICAVLIAALAAFIHARDFPLKLLLSFIIGHRDHFWIADDDLPEDIKADLQSSDEIISSEAVLRRQLDPMKWETFNRDELYHYFACDKVLYSMIATSSSSPRPWWSEEQFRTVRDFYHDFVDNYDMPFIGIPSVGLLIRSTYQATNEVYNMTRNAIPYQSGTEKGRGLKAARDIQQNETILKPSNNTIIFNDGRSFRHFLFALHDRFLGQGLVCDILIWAWVQDMEGVIPNAAAVDLDNSNLINDWEQQQQEENNHNNLDDCMN